MVQYNAMQMDDLNM